MNPPNLIKPYVRSFCRTVCKNEPLFVPLRPLRNKPINECFRIVPEHVANSGGKQVNGWAIWEWPKVMIEAEFHCVWESPEGSLVDIAPKPFPLDKIVFLPDSHKQYRGRQVNNIRKALTRDKNIYRFIELANLIYVELNKGDLADYHWPVTLKGKTLQLHEEMKHMQLMLSRKF